MLPSRGVEISSLCWQEFAGFGKIVIGDTVFYTVRSEIRLENVLNSCVCSQK